MSKKIDGFFDFKTVELSADGKALIILDQTLLPGEVKYLKLSTAESIWDAIYTLKVRGAPAIGVAAAYGIFVLANSCQTDSPSELLEEIIKAKKYLESARPTAVNLFWALNRMKEVAFRSFSAIQKDLPEEEQQKETKFDPHMVDFMKKALKEEALKIHEEDKQTCLKIGENGLKLLHSGMGILTHCNAGALATAGCGTALAPVYLGLSDGYEFRVFADETRPLLQGARLTAWELTRAGGDVTLICDSMASAVMKRGWIDAVITGADRIAANGDSANKIGTSGVAILAGEYGIPVYINAPLSTIDLECDSGDSIRIEERSGEEIYRMWFEKPMSIEGVKTYNPAFDVTDAKYITAIVTEKGVAYPPFRESIRKLFKNDYTEI